MQAAPPLLASALTIATLTGCILDNPSFDETVGATSTSQSAPTSATSQGPGSSSSSSSSSSSIASSYPPTTTSTTGLESTSSLPTTTSTSTADASTTIADLPRIHNIPAELATCVFLPTPEEPSHGPPAQCSGDADAINNSDLQDLMMVDVSVNNLAGKKRPAHPFLRFNIPPELANLTVVAAELHVQVADNVTFLPQTGEVWRSDPFDAVSLETVAPEHTLLLAADQGEVLPNDWIIWTLPPDQIALDGGVFLGLKPTHDKGVILRGATTDPGPPFLRLTIE